MGFSLGETVVLVQLYSTMPSWWLCCSVVAYGEPGTQHQSSPKLCFFSINYQSRLFVYIKLKIKVCLGIGDC